MTLNVAYEEVLGIVLENAIKGNCDTLNVQCYRHILDRFEHSRTREKVRDIVAQFPNDTLIIRLDGHLTCAIDGVIYDIWNCCNEVATDYWIIKG